MWTSRNTKGWYTFLPLLGIVCFSLGFIGAENKPLIVENSSSVLVYHLKGGLLKDFSLKKNAGASVAQPSDSLQEYGHYSLINLGSDATPSFSADCKRILWDLVHTPIIKGKNIEMMMKADLLNERLTVKRFISYPTSHPSIEALEEVTNASQEVRELDLEQHIPVHATSIVYTNLPVESPKGTKIKKLDVENPELAAVIVSDSHSGTNKIYVFKKGDYSGAKFRSDEGNEIVLTGQKQTVPAGGTLSRRYLVVLGNMGKDVKGIERLRATAGGLAIEGTKGESIAEVNIRSLQ